MKPLVILDIASRVTEALVRSPSVPVAPSDRAQVRDTVKEAIVADPVVLNELNGEKPIQSRVLWGNFFAGVGATLAGAMPLAIALGFVTPEEGQAILDGWGALVSATGAVIAMGGVLYSVYGRLASGLKPLFSRKP